jgi:DNA-binding transcriptional regulator YiaG
MKAGQAARKTRVEPNEVVQARQKAGLSQVGFARKSPGRRFYERER